MKYFLAVNGQQTGPFEENELLLNGLTPDSLVWFQGAPNWMKASEVPALQPLFAGTLPQQPAAPQYQQPAPQYQQPQYQQPQYQQPQYPGYEQPAQYQQPQPQYQQPQYGYQQPQYGGQMPPMPNNNMVMAILVTLFCCLPLGIVGIIKASNVSSAYNQGNYELAQKNADEAKKWSMWGLIGGIVVAVLYVILIAAGVASASY